MVASPCAYRGWIDIKVDEHDGLGGPRHSEVGHAEVVLRPSQIVIISKVIVEGHHLV